MLTIENGTYPAIAIPEQSALGESSKGTPCVEVRFQFQGPADLYGQHIVWYGYLSENALKSTVKGLRACGWQGDNLEDLSTIGAKEVELVIENEEFDGKTRAKVRWVNQPGGGATSVPLDPAKKKSIAAMLRNQIRATEAADGTMPKPAARPAPRVPTRPTAASHGPSDSDIPF